MRDRTIFHLLACGLSLFSPLITTPNRPGFRRRTADEMTRLRPRLRPLRHQERGFLRSRLNHQRYRLTSSLASLPRLSHQHPHLSPTCQSNATSPIRREGECKDTPSPLRHAQLAYKYKGQRQITRPTLAWSRRSRSLVGERINVLN